ncbi:hypothetical protein SAMN05421758_103286 [Salimicrobium salexigens]|uniref:Uncharacterized protein n=1 Tax=Salimicrobium salexigens TaxID=908941 RepID=A0ABY1KUV3_9BACI|nr:hypothetical protein SAMN05421758_103286 [Salimicrobium salexigens]
MELIDEINRVIQIMVVFLFSYFPLYSERR